MNQKEFRSIRFDEVADLYDFYVRVDLDVPFWREEAGRVRGKVLELTSGTGRVSIPLLKDGVDLTCVDYSAAMLEILRRKLREARIECPVYFQDMAELELPERYMLAFIPFNSFSEVVGRERQESVLRRVREHLADGGKFICTLQNPVVRTATMDGSVRPVGEFPMEGGTLLRVSSRLEFDAGTGLASGEQYYERRGEDGKVFDRRKLEVRFQLHGRKGFEEMAVAAGFRVEEFYGDYGRGPFDDRTSPFMIWKFSSKKIAE